jgi:hypothetical protein
LYKGIQVAHLRLTGKSPTGIASGVDAGSINGNAVCNVAARQHRQQQNDAWQLERRHTQPCKP